MKKYVKVGTNRMPSATKKGPGRFHQQGYKKTKRKIFLGGILGELAVLDKGK